MRTFLSAPLSPQEIEAVRRRAADLRYGTYREAFLALGRGVRALAAPLTRRLAASRLADEMAALSDRDLADIGLVRSDLSPRRLAEIGRDATLARNERPAAPPPANANARRRQAA
jgi:hypothetical protein